MKKKYVIHPNIICKNCETNFVGNYCPNCSQSTKEFEKPFGFIMYDLMGNIFAFDTRLWRTLKSILFKPGEMTKEFIAGHRVKYMPPFRFYVFISFIFFLLLNLGAQKTIKNATPKIMADSLEFTSLKDSIIAATIISEFNNNDSIVFQNFKNNIDSTIAMVYDDTSSQKSNNLLASDIKAKIAEMKSHPDYFTSVFFKYFSWMQFLLMPAYALLLWIFFRRTLKYFIGHMIFAVNQHAFVFIILIIIMGINFIFPEKTIDTENYLLFAIPLYSLIGAKRLYARKLPTLIFRLTLIYSIYFFLLLISIAISALITFM